MDKQTVGRLGEEKACEFLVQHSMRILERNFRCRLGELDIIAWDSDQLVFVEVRTRSSASFAAPEETVGRRKQQKLKSLANYYLSRKFGREISCRFDVVTLLLDCEGNAVKIDHFQGAFY